MQNMHFLNLLAILLIITLFIIKGKGGLYGKEDVCALPSVF